MTPIPIRIRVQRLHPQSRIPRYAHAGPFGDLAADLHALSSHTLAPGETLAIPTGLAFEFPPTHGALVEDRSSLALRGLATLAGVIDPGFRGELKVILTNLSPEPQAVQPGDRIAQLRIVQRLEATFEEADLLDKTARNQGGFGSTGL